MEYRMIHIIRTIDNAAEKEYLKEFFRFIGCFLHDRIVEENVTDDCRFLQPDNERGGIDVVLNYYGNDPYLSDCQQQGIKRIYCYFDLNKGTSMVSLTPLMLSVVLESIDTATKIKLRADTLLALIQEIWKDSPNICQAISKIAIEYTHNSNGDLFYYLQAKRCLRVMTMGEVLKEPGAQVTQIPFTQYIKQMLRGLWEICVQLKNCLDPYSVYTRINAASMIREIVYKLYVSDHTLLNDIDVAGVPFCIFSAEQLLRELQNLVQENPQFIPAYLLMASICRSYSGPDQDEEHCYFQALQSIPNTKKGYAFIWYRIGYFYEKKRFDIDKALAFYQRAAQVDSCFYQALFKLGYYAAYEGRFNEADMWLNQMIRAIFYGKDDKNGMHENWLALSLKDSQYIYKAYILLAKIAINSNKEYSAKAFIGKACMAATRFEEAYLVKSISGPAEFHEFQKYHKLSTPVWAIWRVLYPWSEDVIQDFFVRDIVRERLSRWKPVQF